MPELSELISRLERELGPAAGEPVAVRPAASRTATTASVSGTTTAWSACRAATRSCSASTALRRGSRPSGPRASGSAPNCSTQMLTASSPSSRPGPRSTPRSCAQIPEGGTRTARLPRQRPGAADPLLDPGSARDYARTVRDRGARLPAGYGRAQALVDRIAAVLPLHRSGAVPQRSSRRQPDPHSGDDSCWSTGSTPGWAIATSTSATWRSTTSSTRRRRCVCSRPTSASGSPSGRSIRGCRAALIPARLRRP